MSRATKKLINNGIIICIIIILVVSAVMGIVKLVEWDTSVPDNFLVIKEVTNKKDHEESHFPKEIQFNYSMKDDIPLIGEDKMYLFGKIKAATTDSSYGFYLIDKKDDEYKFLTGKNKGYPFTEPSFFNLTKPFSFEKQTGTVTVEFLTLNQYQQFLDEVEYGENWRDIIEYIRNKEKEKNPEK